MRPVRFRIMARLAALLQSNDTSPDNVPAHAYLTLNRDGTYAAAWRLPNTYYVNIKTHAQETYIHQRNIWQQQRNMNFIAARRSFEFVLADHYEYMKAIARKNGQEFYGL